LPVEFPTAFPFQIGPDVRAEEVALSSYDRVDGIPHIFSALDAAGDGQQNQF
jgi:hypothetical protein